MSRILAAVDNSAASRPVLATAMALAPTLGATVEAVHVAEDGGLTARTLAGQFGVPFQVVPGDPLAAVTTMAADEDVVAVVVGCRGRPGGRRPAGHLAMALARQLTTPVVMVPPQAVAPDRIGTVLVAMEGTVTNARSLKRAVRIAADAGVELVVLHVDDESSIPNFSDQVQHETDAYAREFLARYCDGATTARLETRIGVPADEILAAAGALSPQLLAMGWPQSDDPSRGMVAREVVDRSHIPVLLVAVE